MATKNYIPTKQGWNQLDLKQNCLHHTYIMLDCIVTVESMTLVTWSTKIATPQFMLSRGVLPLEKVR